MNREQAKEAVDILLSTMCGIASDFPTIDGTKIERLVELLTTEPEGGE